MAVIRKLTPKDALTDRELRLRGLQESPTAFGSSFEQESLRDKAFFENRVRASADQWALGAFDE